MTSFNMSIILIFRSPLSPTTNGAFAQRQTFRANYYHPMKCIFVLVYYSPVYHLFSCASGRLENGIVMEGLIDCLFWS